MLVIYSLHRAAITGDPREVIEAIVWITASAILAFLEISCLLSLGVVSNWKRCVTSDGCPTGQARPEPVLPT